MGKSASKLKYEQLKQTCDCVFTRLSYFIDEPNTSTKQQFVQSIQDARENITLFLEMNYQSKKLNPNLKPTLRIVASVFSKDLESMRKFAGHYDDDFFDKAHQALQALSDLNAFLSNDNLQQINSFREKFTRAFVNLFLWFSAAELRVEGPQEVKIKQVLKNLSVKSN